MYKMILTFPELTSVQRAVPIGIFTDEDAVNYAKSYCQKYEPTGRVTAVLKGSLYNNESVIAYL